MILNDILLSIYIHVCKTREKIIQQIFFKYLLIKYFLNPYALKKYKDFFTKLQTSCIFICTKSVLY